MTERESTSRPSIELERILSSVSRLRPLPGNVTRILRAMEDSKASAGLIADMLSLDQALTAYVLRVANSAHLGYATSCSSLTDAVMRLGFRQIRALVLSTVAAGPLARRLSGYRLGSGDLWQHSIATASIARWLAQAVRYPAAEEAYVAGLLHDMGKLLLDQFVMTDYNKIVEIMWKRKLHLWQVEEQLFGIDHAGVGGLMSSQWGFPVILVDAIRCHHSPSMANASQKLAAIVNVANAFSPQDSAGLSSLAGRMIHPEALNILNLGMPTLEQIRTVMVAKLSEGQVGPPVTSAHTDVWP
jgi:putative nucleotidyltransferase with HDIG domain